jgi:hypothetical protein
LSNKKKPQDTQDGTRNSVALCAKLHLSPCGQLLGSAANLQSLVFQPWISDVLCANVQLAPLGHIPLSTKYVQSRVL